VGAMPIIAVTTAAGPSEVLRYRSCGMNDVVPKPIKAVRLAEALTDAFDEIKRTRRSGRRQPLAQGAA
jgi:CheY-like chemotaxis protein